MNEKQRTTFSKRVESEKIPEKKEVRVTIMNHIIEVLCMGREPKALLDYVKIDKYRYMHRVTGEIFDFAITENRAQNIAGVKRTQRKIRHIINANFTGAKNELWLTTTYAEEMKDTKKLMRDFEVFIKRLKRKNPNIEYMSVVEPQGRGAWHCHVLIKDESKNNLYIHNDEMAKMWGHGWTTTKRPKSVDNIGAYLSAYLSDLEVSEENKENIINAMQVNGANITIEEKEVEQDGKKVKKKFAKGARLHMYPNGMNIYRCSRGIKKPETIKMDYGEVKKIVGSATPNYSRTIDLNHDEQVINSITYEQYNLRRGKIEV